MKKLLFLLIISLVYLNMFSQTTCPTSVTNFNFVFSKPVTNDLKVGGASVCDPDNIPVVTQTETWSIDGSQTNWKITFDGHQGANILVNDANAINSSTSTIYNITIRVTDNGVPPLSSTATVTLTDVNNPPVINSQTFSIAENSVNGTTVGTVVATDPESNQTKTFSILSGNFNGAFSINASTGILSVSNTAALNYELTPTYALVIKVQDNGTGNLSSQATITINSLNVNEAPVIKDQVIQ